MRWVLWSAAAALVLASACLQLLATATRHDHMYGLVPLTNVDEEANLPSYFSSLLLLAVAVLLGLTGGVARNAAARDARAWWALGVVALVMAVDEAAGLHELLNRPAAAFVGGSGWFHFGWVVPGAVVAAALAIGFRPFFSRQDSRLRARMLLAGGLYFAGALGMEMAGGQHAAAHGNHTLVYRALLVSVEEGLEMAGAIVLIDALLVHLGALAPQLRITVRCRRTAATAPALRPGTRQPGPLPAGQRPARTAGAGSRSSSLSADSGRA